MTRKLYFNNPYIVDFTAKVKEQRKYNENYALIFEETFFYPSTGGQEHDSGWINNIPIIDIIEENGDILHIIKSTLNSDNAECKIDWKRRFDFMQQHTGQHILSESLQKVYGYETISSRLSEDSSTIDLNTVNLTYEQILKVEEYANQIIYNNLDVKVYYVNDEQVSSIPLRKPPKFSGEIRIVEIDGFDYSACGGTHCRKTGEVGLIKVRKWEKVKGNLTRLEFFCGRRALYDYQWKNQIVMDLAVSMTVKDVELQSKILKIIEDSKTLQKKCENYKSQVLDFEAEQILKESILEKNIRIVKRIFKNRDISEIRILIQKLVEKGEVIVLLGLMNEQANIIFARSADLNQNMLALFNGVSVIIGAKGGGKPDFVQAGCKNQDKLQEALDFALRNLEV